VQIINEIVRPQREELIAKGKQIHTYSYWQFWDARPYLYRTIAQMERVLVVGQVSKFPNFAFTNTDKVLDAKLVVIAHDHNDIYCLLQSGIHYEWITKYATTLETRLNYTPTVLFETFPFPQNISPEQAAKLENIGKTYDKHRCHIMLSLQIGLTKTYNLFHKKDLSIADLEKVAKQPIAVCEKGYQDIFKLRELHVEMDNDVLAAYDWTDLNLAHDFYEVDYLPENDRIRFTISPDARREVLKRLLKLNHEIHEQEVKAGLWDKKKTTKKEKTISNMVAEPTLFYGADPENNQS